VTGGKEGTRDWGVGTNPESLFLQLPDQPFTQLLFSLEKLTKIAGKAQ
jgi:hypothetical protein